MRVHIKTYAPLLLALLTAACSTADDDTAATTTVALNAVVDTRADAAPAVQHPNPRFIFWLKSDYEAGNLGTTQYDDAQVVTKDATLGTGTSYATTTPSDDIEYYTDLKYNLGRAYPDVGVIYATGYWPSALTASADNTTLTVPDDVRRANTDILVARQLVQGSKGSPFHEPLTFIHACVQLTFKALRAGTMTNFVDNVYVQVLEMPGRLEWTGAAYPDSRYVAHRQLAYTDVNTMTAADWDDNFPKAGPNVQEGTTGTTNKAQLDKSVWRDIDGALYIAPGNGVDGADLSAVWLRITYDTSTSQDFRVSTANTAIVAVPVATTDGMGALQGGDAYTIELTFDDVAVSLRAVKTEWQQGGNVILPFMLTEQ